MNPHFLSRSTAIMVMVMASWIPLIAQAQQTTIYRCHSLSSGQLIFQDKPCDQVAGTQEAQKGSAGDIIPNAAPAPDTNGPSQVERYENYLDAESARSSSDAATAAANVPVEATGTRRTYGYPGVPAVDGYSGYSEGIYPYPVYPPYFNRERPPTNNGVGPAPTYYNGPQALPKPLPLPSSSFPQQPQRVAPAASPPGHVVARDPNH